MTQTRTARIEDRLLAGSLAYRVLSQAFAYPTSDALAALRDDDLPLALAAADELPDPVADALGSLAGTLREASAGILERAFCDLFTHIHSADCPMYETDYRARDVWRQSSVLVDVAGFYRAFGMREQGERADHVAAELEFLHAVTYKQAWALATRDPANAGVCREAEVAFLRDHALRWIPGFAARVETLSGGGPYGAAAAALRQLLRSEAERHGLEVPAEARPEPLAEIDEAPSFCEVEE